MYACMYVCIYVYICTYVSMYVQMEYITFLMYPLFTGASVNTEYKV